MNSGKQVYHRHGGVPTPPTAFLERDRKSRRRVRAPYGLSHMTEVKRETTARSSLAFNTTALSKRREYIPPQKTKTVRAMSAGVKKQPMLVRPGSGYRKMGKFARSSLQSSEQVARSPYRRPQSVGPKQRRRSLPTAVVLNSSASSVSSASLKRSPSTAGSPTYRVQADGFGSIVKSSPSKVHAKNLKSSSASTLVAQALFESNAREGKKRTAGTALLVRYVGALDYTIPLSILPSLTLRPSLLLSTHSTAPPPWNRNTRQGTAQTWKTGMLAWGANDFGQCGCSEQMSSLTFTYRGEEQVLTPREILCTRDESDGMQSLTKESRPFRLLHLSTGPRHVLMVRDDGKVYGWGYNLHGQVDPQSARFGDGKKNDGTKTGAQHSILWT